MSYRGGKAAIINHVFYELPFLVHCSISTYNSVHMVELTPPPPSTFLVWNFHWIIMSAVLVFFLLIQCLAQMANKENIPTTATSRIPAGK